MKTDRKVAKAVWGDRKGEWTVTVEDTISGQVFEDTCDILVRSTGFLNDWKWPEVEGFDKFKGTLVHTANWDESVSLDGKIVGLIGNG